jgi:integrase/recombinase XerC
VLTYEQLKTFLQMCEGKDFYARRDTAILQLLIDTGVRRAEIAGLRVQDIDWDMQTAVVLGKGRRPRACPFHLLIHPAPCTLSSVHTPLGAYG